jgi:hypothetical protein
MRVRLVASSIGTLALCVGLLHLAPAHLSGQSAAGTVPKTAWGAPDLQGIWNDPFDEPLQRPAKYANQELFTPEQLKELDEKRASLLRREYRDKNAEGKATEQDVAGAYNALFESHRPTGKYTSLIVDPPDGRVPALTPEAAKRREEYRAFALELLKNTETCKNQAPSCRGGAYGPPSPRRNDISPIFSIGRVNRADGPEDRGMGERCMGSAIPDLGGYRRIVQNADTITIWYDVGQGQGFERVIPITNAPHIPANIRRWWGDPRAHWEGNTLVVDVTNFTPKTDFQGSRENLHLVERWTRVDATTLHYEVRVEDPTTWVKPWTIRNDLKLQDSKLNRIYYEPRCSDTNFGLAGILSSRRAEERLFSEGKGPDPFSRDIAVGGAGGGEDNSDPLGGTVSQY